MTRWENTLSFQGHLPEPMGVKNHLHWALARRESRRESRLRR